MADYARGIQRSNSHGMDIPFPSLRFAATQQKAPFKRAMELAHRPPEVISLIRKKNCMKFSHSRRKLRFGLRPCKGV